MATISITIPDSALNRVVDGIAGEYEYQDEIRDINFPDEEIMIPNPETKAQFAKRQVAIFVKQAFVGYEAKQAAETNRLAAIAEANKVEIT